MSSIYNSLQPRALFSTGQLGPLFREYAQLQISILENQREAEYLEDQLNLAGNRLALFDEGYKYDSRKALGRLVRVLTYRLLQCRKTRTSLVANMAIVTEQMQYVQQHQSRCCGNRYGQAIDPRSIYPMHERQMTSPASSFVCFSTPIVFDPTPSEQTAWQTSPSPASSSLSPISNTSWWSSCYDDSSYMSSPCTGFHDTDFYHYSPSCCSCSYSSLESPPFFASQQTYTTPQSEHYTERWQKWTFDQPVMWTNYDHGSPSPNELISPLTNLSLGQSTWASTSSDKIAHRKKRNRYNVHKKTTRREHSNISDLIPIEFLPGSSSLPLELEQEKPDTKSPLQVLKRSISDMDKPSVGLRLERTVRRRMSWSL